MFQAITILMLAFPRIDVALVESQGMESRKALALTEALAEAAERQSGAHLTVRTELPCPWDAPRCAGSLPEQLGVHGVLVVRLIQGRRLTAMSVRYLRRGAAAQEEELVIPRAGASQAALRALMSRFFKAPIVERKAPVTLVEPPKDRALHPGVWGLLGAGVAAGAGALGFGLSSASARGRLRMPIALEAYDDAASRMRAHGLASNVLWGTAAAAAVSGLVWLLIELSD